jgi:hypothetical protein
MSFEVPEVTTFKKLHYTHCYSLIPILSSITLTVYTYLPAMCFSTHPYMYQKDIFSEKLWFFLITFHPV